MRDEPHVAPNVRRAVDFFVQADLSHLLKLMRDKYIEVGQIGGQVTITESTPQQRRELASFLGKPSYVGETFKVRLRDMDNALQQSGFACTIVDVLQALTPQQPLVTRKERRVAHAIEQTAFHESLQALLTQIPTNARAYQWLVHGQHGIEWLYTRYKNLSHQEQEQQLQSVHLVVHALSLLPDPDTPERLALFAQRISGNPHALDTGTTVGRLFLLALQDLASDTPQSARGEEEQEPVQPSQSRMQEVRLYARFGLLVDTISSRVAAYNLGGATFLNGETDQFVEVAGQRVLLLPLRQIYEWRSVTPMYKNIYVFENPQVFEEVVEQLPHGREMPSLICTSGWPGVAALLLLDLLLSQSPDNTLYYSGDFDLKGLQIAAYLLSRYPERITMWHTDPHGYEIALHNGGIQAKPKELELLDTLPDVFATLVKAIQARGMWAYQEGVTKLLCEDILREVT